MIPAAHCVKTFDEVSAVVRESEPGTTCASQRSSDGDLTLLYSVILHRWVQKTISLGIS